MDVGDGKERPGSETRPEGTFEKMEFKREDAGATFVIALHCARVCVVVRKRPSPSLAMAKVSQLVQCGLRGNHTMVRYNEFTVVGDDGAYLRIRETFPDDPASDAPPTYELLNSARSAVIERLPDGRYRVDGKFYARLRGD
jgi:hypothetical protein